MSSNGVLIFAHNNTGIDYTKLAVFAANRVKQFLDLPVSLATNNLQWLLAQYPDHPFDNIIELPIEPSAKKIFYDGSLSNTHLEWNNTTRYQAYELTPYDKTLVIDSDFIVSSDVLKIAFQRDVPFQIYKNNNDLADWRNPAGIKRLNEYSIPFYWATVFVFEKNFITRAFFDLVAYIKSNWLYFRILYNIEATIFRNDFAFSIAIHIMNNKIEGDFAIELPGAITYSTDRDLLLEIKDTTLKFLIEKKGHRGEYIAAKTSGLDVHVMNKSSLSRFIDGGFGV